MIHNGIPAWLQRHLEATGRADTDSIRRRVQASTCRTCHAPILTGLDAVRAAMPARTQPHPVSTLGETLALTAGAPTYDLIDTGDRYELDLRDTFSIPGPRRWPVLAAHRCGVTWPTEAEAPAVTTRRENPDVCPY